MKDRNQFLIALASLGIAAHFAGHSADAEPRHLVNRCGTYRLHGILEGKPDALVLWKGTSRELRLAITGECRRCGFFHGITVEAEARLVALSPRRITVSGMKASAETEEFLNEKAAELVEESPCPPG